MERELLLAEMEHLRRELEQAGLPEEERLRISRQLDELINRYLRETAGRQRLRCRPPGSSRQRG